MSNFKDTVYSILLNEKKQSETITANGDDPQNVDGTDINSNPRVTLRTEIDPKTGKIIDRIVNANGRSQEEQAAWLEANKDKKVAIPGARGNVGALEYIDSNGDTMTYPASSQADGAPGLPILRSAEDLTGVDPEQMKKNYSADPQYLKYSAIIKKIFKSFIKSPVPSPEMSPKPAWVTKREQQEKDNDTYQIRGINDKGLQPPEEFISNQAISNDQAFSNFISNGINRFFPKNMSPKPAWVTKREQQQEKDKAKQDLEDAEKAVKTRASEVASKTKAIKDAKVTSGGVKRSLTVPEAQQAAKDAKVGNPFGDSSRPDDSTWEGGVKVGLSPNESARFNQVQQHPGDAISRGQFMDAENANKIFNPTTGQFIQLPPRSKGAPLPDTATETQSMVGTQRPDDDKINKTQKMRAINGSDPWTENEENAGPVKDTTPGSEPGGWEGEGQGMADMHNTPAWQKMFAASQTPDAIKRRAEQATRQENRSTRRNSAEGKVSSFDRSQALKQASIDYPDDNKRRSMAIAQANETHRRFLDGETNLTSNPAGAVSDTRNDREEVERPTEDPEQSTEETTNGASNNSAIGPRRPIKDSYSYNKALTFFAEQLKRKYIEEEVVNPENQPMTKSEISHRDRIRHKSPAKDARIVKSADKTQANAAYRLATYITMRGRKGKKKENK